MINLCKIYIFLNAKISYYFVDLLPKISLIRRDKVVGVIQTDNPNLLGKKLKKQIVESMKLCSELLKLVKKVKIFILL